MARRIYIKDGGLNTLPTIPTGYTTLGTDGGEFKKKIIDTISNIGGGSSKTRVDVLSVGVKANDTNGNTKRFTTGQDWKNLLWEIVDSSGNYLQQDTIYTSDVDLEIDVENYITTQGIDITVKGYYYLDQSKEKFRIVGRNLAYWSLVGLNNYARMRTRGENNIDISPGTLGENIITALNSYSSNTGYESLAYITNTGRGLAFSTSTRSNNICVTDFQKFENPAATIFGRTLLDHNTSGILNDGTLVPLFGLSSPNTTTTNYEQSLLVWCNRNGLVQVYTGTGYDSPSVDQAYSLLQLYKLRVFTTEYPSDGPDSGLIVWYVRPIGQDTFLLNNNNSKLNDDNVYLIPENRYKNVFLPKLTNIYIKLDNTGFGQDTSVDETKTGLDRYGNIWVENIPGFGNSNKHKSIGTGYSRRIKFRVAYGKLGNFTLSDDYIIYKSRRRFGNGFIAMVNKY